MVPVAVVVPVVDAVVVVAVASVVDVDPFFLPTRRIVHVPDPVPVSQLADTPTMYRVLPVGTMYLATVDELASIP